MFTKDNKTKSDGSGADMGTYASSPAMSSSAPSIISADLTIKGNMSSNGDIQIDGKIDGDVESKSLTIGEGAEVNGTLSCERVRVCGKVSGEIRANSVVLARSAKVDGDIAHKTLEIEAGASLQGGVRQLESAPAPKAKKAAESPKGDNVSSISEVKPNGQSSSAAAI